MTSKLGDVVLLKSGGPPMTVVSVDEGEVSCIWIGEEGELFRETLPTIALEPIESETCEDDLDDGGEDEEDADDDEKIVESEDNRLRRAGKK